MKAPFWSPLPWRERIRVRGTIERMNPVAPTWHTPPDPLRLPDDEVHVWRIELDRSDGRARLEFLLSDDEKKRAHRFRSKTHQSRYIIGRGSLRAILARYVNQGPERLVFAYEDFGKPALSEPVSDMQFNMTHSHGLALCAVSRHRRIGVDIERLRDVVDRDRIVARFFSRSEQDEYHSLPEELKREGFFRGWTRKEAYLKALGIGISTPLDSFSVSLDPREPALLREVVKKPEEVGRWRFENVDATLEDVGALAVEGLDWITRSFAFESS